MKRHKDLNLLCPFFYVGFKTTNPKFSKEFGIYNQQLTASDFIG